MTTAADIPLARGRRLLGNAYDYERDRIEFLRSRVDRYGDVFRYDPATVVVSDPDLIHAVLAETNKTFLARTPLIEHRDTAQANLLAWMRGRRQGARGVHPGAVSDCLSILDRALTRALAGLAGREVGLVAATERICGRAIVDVVLGEADEGMYDLAATTSAAVLATSHTLGVAPWQVKRRRARAAAQEQLLTTVLHRMVTARRVDRPADLADVLLAGSRPLPAPVIAAILRIAIVGGHGTPGAALAWTIRELARRPDVLARVRAEAGALPAAAAANDLGPLPYATALAREMLRTYPPTWLLAREVPRPVTLGRWRLDAGQQVVFSPYVVHRDPRWWAEPDRVLPERWLGDAAQHPPRAYLPFGGGPRVCLGARLGLTMLVLATARLAAEYEVDSIGLADAEPHPDVLLVPSDVRIRLTASRTASVASGPPGGAGPAVG